MQKDFIGEPKQKYIAHICQEVLKKHNANVLAGKKMAPLMSHSVLLHTALDPRFRVGQCSKCKEIVTEKIEE